MRLDKFLCDNNIGTRSQVKEYIKKGQVTVNDQIIKKPETKVNNETDTVVCQGQTTKSLSCLMRSSPLSPAGSAPGPAPG